MDVEEVFDVSAMAAASLLSLLDVPRTVDLTSIRGMTRDKMREIQAHNARLGERDKASLIECQNPDPGSVSAYVKRLREYGLKHGLV